MSRIALLELDRAGPDVQPLFDAVQAQLGAVPNFIRALGNSAPALRGFLGLIGALDAAGLDVQVRERIALAIAERNACQYCLSTHEALATQAGLGAGEIEGARRGQSSDPQADAAVKFAVSLNELRGEVTAAEIEVARRAGLGDAVIVEVIAVVALNVFTNMLGKAGEIDIDFPAAHRLSDAA